MEILLNYDYPGNVRELENVLEHALIICHDDVIQRTHLPDYIHTRMASPRNRTAAPLPPKPAGGYDERQQILNFLEQNHGNRGKTAQALGIDRTTLWRKMKRYGIRPS